MFDHQLSKSYSKLLMVQREADLERDEKQREVAQLKVEVSTLNDMLKSLQVCRRLGVLTNYWRPIKEDSKMTKSELTSQTSQSASSKEKQTQLMYQLEQEKSKQQTLEKELSELKQRLQTSDQTIKSLNQQISIAKRSWS